MPNSPYLTHNEDYPSLAKTVYNYSYGSLPNMWQLRLSSVQWLRYEHMLETMKMQYLNISY